MSIELCNIDGDEVAGLLTEKLVDTRLAIKVGGKALNLIIRATHTGDGLVVIEYQSDADKVDMFQFSPSIEPFSQTAVDADGQPICTDC